VKTVEVLNLGTVFKYPFFVETETLMFPYIPSINIRIHYLSVTQC